MNNDEVRRLVRLARGGDTKAFALLFEEHRKVVYAVAYRLVGANDADDVVMETYLKAWRAFPRFNERAAVRTWLYRITHNCALDVLRSRRRRQERVLPDHPVDGQTVRDFADDNQAAPNERIMREERARQVRRALDQLNEPYRSVLLLRYADELSYAEIAAATGVSIGTVMSRLFYGKRKLKAICQHEFT